MTYKLNLCTKLIPFYENNKINVQNLKCPKSIAKSKIKNRTVKLKSKS